MTEVVEIFDPVTGRYHKHDPWTSKAAAKHVNVGDGQLKVLRALVNAGGQGLTDYEISVRTGMLRTAAGTRRKELAERKLVAETTDARKTDTQRWAKVHRITTAGELLYRELTRGQS